MSKATLLLAGLMLSSFASANVLAAGPPLKNGSTASNNISVSKGKSLWGWQINEQCTGTKKEVRYNTSTRNWSCHVNNKIVNIK